MRMEWAKGLGRRVHRALAFRRSSPRLAPEDAYRLWAKTYDLETDNVVLTLERKVFSALLADVDLGDKVVLDVGCGTGRHWPELLAAAPRRLHGVDSSPEMLAELRARHPDAELHWRSAARIDPFSDGSVDVVISTLMLGHVRDAAVELAEWARILKPAGEMIVTDFHPQAFRSGMKRTFNHGGVTFEVENHAHPIEALKSILASLRLELVRLEEAAIDASTRESFERRNFGAAYRKSVGMPLVAGFRLRRFR